MLYPKLEKGLLNAKRDLDRASSETIIGLCKQYLTLLAEYRGELYKLPERLGINRWSGSFLLDDVNNTRKAVHLALENLTRERNQTEALLRSLTAVSGYEAVEVFNARKYKGHDDWELSAGGIGFGGGIAERMNIQEAVSTASLLRRKEHVLRHAVGCQPLAD